MKRIVLTGGGTAGHVTPNIALLPRLRSEDYEIFYIGSTEGIEKKLIQAQGIPYYGISSGKLRRYFDVKNFTGSFPRPERICTGFQTNETVETGCGIFQGRICLRPSRYGSQTPSYSGHLPRIGPDSGAGQ